jgi:hypothetical protein
MPQLSGNRNSYWGFFDGKARAYLFPISILAEVPFVFCPFGLVQLEWNGKCRKTKFHLAGKWHSPRNTVGVANQSTSGSRVVHHWYKTMFRSRVTLNGYPLPSPLSPFTSHPTHHHMPCFTNQVLLISPLSEVNQMYCDGHYTSIQ